MRSAYLRMMEPSGIFLTWMSSLSDETVWGTVFIYTGCSPFDFLSMASAGSPSFPRRICILSYVRFRHVLSIADVFTGFGHLPFRALWRSNVLNLLVPSVLPHTGQKLAGIVSVAKPLSMIRSFLMAISGCAVR